MKQPTNLDTSTLLESLKADKHNMSAHHEAGHAVASVARGGELTKIWFVPWRDRLKVDPNTTKHALTRSCDQLQNRPFVVFAGPWSQARWYVENGAFDSFRDEMGYAWEDNGGEGDIGGDSYNGDAVSYEGLVRQLSGMASWPELGYDDAPMGYTEPGRYWEARWNDELDELWPAIREVAALLLDGTECSHEAIVRMIETARS